MIASHHPSIRHWGKNAPFGLPRRKGNLSRPLALKIYKSETFLYPLCSGFQQPVSLCCIAPSPTCRCITVAVLPLEHEQSGIKLVYSYLNPNKYIFMSSVFYFFNLKNGKKINF